MAYHHLMNRSHSASSPPPRAQSNIPPLCPVRSVQSSLRSVRSHPIYGHRNVAQSTIPHRNKLDISRSRRQQCFNQAVLRRHNAGKPRERGQGHSAKSASLQTMSSLSHLSLPSPPPERTKRAERRSSHHHQHFVYNQTVDIADSTKHRNSCKAHQPRRRHRKRRIRTFYCKKWGNRLYGLTSTPSPSSVSSSASNSTSKPESKPNVEEERLDLNENTKSPPPQQLQRPAAMQHLSVGYRLHQEDAQSYYDSAVSNIADNTDIEQEEYDEDLDDEADDPLVPCANFKIVVSAPNRNRNQNGNNERDGNYVDEYDEGDDEEQRNAFRARMRSKRRGRHQRRQRQRQHLGSDVESAATSDYSSCDEVEQPPIQTDGDDDDEDDDVDGEHLNGLYEKQRLFLGGNNLDCGVYSTFNARDYSSESDTDYLSAQSDDFNQLKICYRSHSQSQSQAGNKKRSKLIKSDKLSINNIRFRDEIGSSDTDWCSSADSIPDSIPPHIHSDFLKVIHR